MFEIVKAGGPIMGPIILASIVAAAIILERLWTLQTKRVLPTELTDKVWRWVEQGQIQDKHIAALEQNSPLGKVLAAGLANRMGSSGRARARAHDVPVVAARLADVLNRTAVAATKTGAR